MSENRPSLVNTLPSLHERSTASSAPRWANVSLVVAAAVYLILAGYVVSLSHNQLNPDGVAYLQTARHYADGRLDLAVNSYWGPLLSWLLVPAVWAKADETLVVKLLGILLGLVFAAGVRSLAAKLGCPQHRSLAFAAALMLAVCMLPAPITPDLLMAAVLTWYLALSVELLWRGSAASAFRVGALGGLAYWVKAYALPFVFVHLCVTFAMRWWVARRRGAAQTTARPFAVAVAGQFLVALPWIVIISVHDGAFTTGSAGRLTRAAFSPISGDSGNPGPIQLLQRPRSGRVSSWENPVEIPGNWSEWSPLDGARGARHQLLTTFREGIKTLTYLKNADALGLLMCGWLILLCLLMKSGFPTARKEDVACLWACLTVGVYAGGYSMIYSEQRFLWAVWGIMLAAAIAAFAQLGGKSDGLHHAAPAPDSTAAPRSRLARNCLAGILLASISYNVLVTLDEWRGPSGLGRDADWVRDASRTAVGARQCAATDWYTGLYLSFWARTTFLGRIDGRSAEAVARELLPYGDTRVLVYEDSALSQGLSESPLFSRVADSTNPVGRRQLVVFDFHPSPEPAR